MSRQAKQTALVENQWKNWHFYLLFIALSFVFYGSSLKNKYAMDDDLVTTTYQYNEDGSRELISRHPNVEKGFSGIPSILTSHFAVNKKQRYEYRPVVTAVFAIEYQLFGSNPTISHFFNTLFYALVVILIFRFFRIAYPSGSRWFAAIVALLFLIHPLHSEVVNNIKSRDELLCLAFGLGAMINLLKYLDRKKLMFLIAALLLLLCSLLCKKTGMTFIPFLLLTAYYFRALRLGKLLVFFGSIVGVFLIWKLISKGMITESVAREKQFFENPLYFSQSFAERIPMYFYSNFYYLKLLLFPYPLRFYYGFNQVSIATWATPIVWFMAAFMVSLVSWIMRRMKKREVWGFGVLLFFFGIGGACNLLFPAVGIIAERFAFVASLGFCIVVASGLMYLFKIAGSRKRMIGSISIGVLLIVSLTAVLSRNPAWSSRNSLYETDIVNLQESAKSHSLIAQLYASELKSLRGKLMGSQSPMNRRLVEEYNKKLQLTLHHFTRCIEIDTSYAVSYNNLGAMYFLYKADVDSSRMNFERALIFFHMKNLRHSNLCPKTASLIDSMEEIITCEFSWLPANTHILPHKGYSKMVLRCHLPLVVPEGELCKIRVGTSEHVWKEGELVIFDDSFEHEAWNNSEEDRVVLMFDIPNPNWKYTPDQISKYKIDNIDDPFLLSVATKEQWQRAYQEKILPDY